jgi:hypothetical protein
MAGTFYSIARNDMKYRMQEKLDGTAGTRFASEWVTETAPVAAATGDPDTRGGFLARVLRFATRPAARPKAAGCDTC